MHFGGKITRSYLHVLRGYGVFLVRFFLGIISYTNFLDKFPLRDLDYSTYLSDRNWGILTIYDFETALSQSGMEWDGD